MRAVWLKLCVVGVALVGGVMVTSCGAHSPTARAAVDIADGVCDVVEDIPGMGFLGVACDWVEEQHTAQQAAACAAMSSAQPVASASVSSTTRRRARFRVRRPVARVSVPASSSVGVAASAPAGAAASASASGSN